MTSLSRLVVLISGTGSNLQAILDACASGELPASVVSVISNKADAYGLTRARNAGIEAIYFPKLETESRKEYDARLAVYVSTCLPDYIILAGWMRILSSSFLSSFPNRVINLHPALPDTFPGTHAIERAFEAYQHDEIKHTGVMVHLVPDEGVDNGPVLATETIPIYIEDTLESLEVRVHESEHKLLIRTLKKVIQYGFKTPNLTLDTSCVIPLLRLASDQTNLDEIIALEGIKLAHDKGELKIWISQKSINEARLNLEIAGTNQARIDKWISTINLLEEFDTTQSVWVWGASSFGLDTVFASNDQVDKYEEIKKVLVGNKSNVELGDTFDIAILYEHQLQGNEMSVTLDNRMFRKTVVDKLHDEFAIRIVTPKNVIEILKTEYFINL